MPREPPNTNAIFLLITLPLSLSAYRDGHDTLFGHFTNGVARPLAPETAVLGAPVGHEVDTGARGFVDMNAAHLQAPGSVEGVLQAVGEDTRSEPERCDIHAADGLIQRGEGQQADDRPEDPAAADQIGRASWRERGWQDGEIPG